MIRDMYYYRYSCEPHTLAATEIVNSLNSYVWYKNICTYLLNKDDDDYYFLLYM